MGVEPTGVDCQIAHEWMALCEGQDFLFTLLADQAVKIFKALGTGFKRLEQAVLIVVAECCLI
jgi:hypothetical protein